MGQVTHEQANLLLRLYEIRREPRLREARSWVAQKFDAKTMEEMNALCPRGSEENANVRMTMGYWDMAAGLANRGLIDEDLFCENAGEAWFIWDRIRHVVPAMRAAYNNPNIGQQLETFAKRYENWKERQMPSSGGTTSFQRPGPVVVKTAAE